MEMGWKNEITEGQVTGADGLLSPSGLPQSSLPKTDGWLQKWGRTLFTSIGCADCHVPDIILKTTRYRLLERGARGVLDIPI